MLRRRVVRLIIWPGLFMMLPFTKRTRVLVRAGDAILLVRGSLAEGTWSLPGGGLHWREQPAEGAARELREETGVAVEPTTLRHLYSGWHAEGPLKFYGHFYVLDLPAPVELTRRRFEIAEVAWQPLATLPAVRTRFEVRRALQLLAERP